MSKRILTLRESIFSALFLALIIAGAYIAVPVGPVPIVMQNLFILVTALLLPTRLSIIIIIAYLTSGIIGLPVFSGGKGGIAHLLGPTGGYLFAYLPATIVASVLSNKFKTIGRIAGSFLFLIILYSGGLFWLAEIHKFGWIKAINIGFFPFIFFDLLKVIAAVFATSILHPFMKRYLK